eukprot:CAMPEP_0201283258 /NCGR_PEP_ID=MMETSP1317-20130820/8079_1 /ASSEMBLY_ACC=CAM_ASM_000770 /TAXON_ID=187299 /ORGANISM="Undescribed Undescribed, Strain Undescribed" /LENGTH=98 /DNA_ID=CAMNT_0047598897 /DNA_START=427 /DNA_END=723 /DNA_ORIENTATION=-
MNLKELLDFGKLQVNESNKLRRDAGSALVVTIYSQVGQPLVPLLQDIKEATLKVIMEQLDRTEVGSNCQFRTGAEQDPANLEDFPRNDISKEVKKIYK